MYMKNPFLFFVEEDHQSYGAEAGYRPRQSRHKKKHKLMKYNLMAPFTRVMEIAEDWR